MRVSDRDDASRWTFQYGDRPLLVGTWAGNRLTDDLKGGEQVDLCCTSQRGDYR